MAGSTRHAFRAAAVVAATAAVFATPVAHARPAGAPAPTAGAYRAQATAICAALNRYQVPADVSFVAGMQRALGKTRSSLAALSRLEPPVALRSLHAQAVQEETALVSDFAVLLDRVRSHALAPAQLITALGKDEHALRGAALWRRLGVPACAG